ncbi:MAG: MarR family transcriptional regulator [Actinomycetota bacterium]|nr:MarR family transcriptional regulator [Actinomycetota bacterium]
MQSKLTGDEQLVWGGFLRTHARLIRELDHELRREHELPLSSYDVLTQLGSAPDERMRMSELADAVLLSRSGLTRLVDRLVSEGLIERRDCPDDARGLLAALTPGGRELLERARVTHHAGIRRLFFEPLDPKQRRRLAESWERLGGAPPTARAGAVSG